MSWLRYLMAAMWMAGFGMAAGPALADPAGPMNTCGTTKNLSCGTAADPYRRVPATGWFYAVGENGRGYSIESNLLNTASPSSTQGRIFFATYAYQTSGQSVWYVATLTNSTDTTVSSTGGGAYPVYSYRTPYTGTLVAYTGGQTINGVYRAPASQSLGTMTLTVTGEATAQITWPASLATAATTITGYNFAGSFYTPPAASTVPQGGWWYNANEGGRGYFLEVQGTTLFFAGYMYRADGTAVWYVASGALTNGSSFSGSLVEYAGGPTFPQPTKTGATGTTAGTVALTFSSPAQGTISLNGAAPLAITRYTQF